MGKLVTFLAGAVTGVIGVRIAAILTDKYSRAFPYNIRNFYFSWGK